MYMYMLKHLVLLPAEPLQGLMQRGISPPPPPPPPPPRTFIRTFLVLATFLQIIVHPFPLPILLMALVQSSDGNALIQPYICCSDTHHIYERSLD